MKKKKLKGFTLIEIIVVIAILGILMAILVPSFIG
jgi:type IV pilus assembly protein PilA